MHLPPVLSATSLGHLQAMIVVEELRRCGVDLFCVSPGARAIPLLLALEAHPAGLTKLFHDERSAAFWAQGAAKGGRLPCLICTSGTAAANYLPAVIEAALAGAPMVVLTTDRPFELHYAKANQTLPQRELFAPFVALTIDVPAPEHHVWLHALLADLDQAVFELQRTARPVHLNLAYRKPFVEAAFTVESLPVDEQALLARWRVASTPYCAYLQPQVGLTPAATQQLVDRVCTAETIVCVAGPLAPWRPPGLLPTLARHLGAPLFADIHSGLRCAGPQQPAVLALYHCYLRQQAAQLPRADLVLYFGDRIISEPLREYVAAQQAECLLCSPYPLRQDAIENEYLVPTMKVWGEPSMVAEALLAALPARLPTALTRNLQAAEATAQAQLDRLLAPPAAGPLPEGRLIAAVFQHSLPETAIFLSASLIVREADAFVPWRPLRLHVGANRGATGIDGILSSGLGFAEGLHTPCTVIIGDQALLHDLNALALVAAASVPVSVIVINNHGGAIFHFFDLGVTGERLQNPHPWDFRGVAANFQLPYVCPPSFEAFVAAYQAAQAQGRSTVFELIVDGAASVRLFQAAGRA